MDILVTVPEQEVSVLIAMSGVFGALRADARWRQDGCRYYPRDAAIPAAVVGRGDAPLPTPLLHGQPRLLVVSDARPSSRLLITDTLVASRMVILTAVIPSSRVRNGSSERTLGIDATMFTTIGIGPSRLQRPSG